MPGKLHLSKNFTLTLIYGRLPLAFGGMICALAVMWTRNPMLYALGTALLFIAMAIDLVDEWFADRFNLHSTFTHLADRAMDKISYSIIFPLVAVGMMWRLHFTSASSSKAELLHAIFILLLCVTVLVRDNFAPGVGQASCDPFFQGAEPMTLADAVNAG